MIHYVIFDQSSTSERFEFAITTQAPKDEKSLHLLIDDGDGRRTLSFKTKETTSQFLVANGRTHIVVLFIFI